MFVFLVLNAKLLVLKMKSVFSSNLHKYQNSADLYLSLHLHKQYKSAPDLGDLYLFLVLFPHDLADTLIT